MFDVALAMFEASFFGYPLHSNIQLTQAGYRRRLAAPVAKNTIARIGPVEIDVPDEIFA